MPDRTKRLSSVAVAAGLSLAARSALGTVIWTGNPANGTGVFKLLNLENADKVEEPNPSPNGSSITTSSDPAYGPDFQFYKASPDLRAEAHGANGFTATVGDTYFIGWQFKVNSTVQDNAVFQWKAFDNTGSNTTLEQNFPIVLSFSSGNLQLSYYTPITGTQNVLFSQPETANVWNSVVLEINVESNTTGTINFWWDGTEQNLAGQGLTYNGRTWDGDYCDPKWGIYGAVGTQVTDDVTSLKIGTTYADVAPTIISMPSLTWDNAGGSPPANGTSWDTTNNNWNNGTNATTYSDDSALTFSDANNAHYAVTLNTTVQPGSVTVNNSSGNYVLSGTGSITGNAPLVKNGTGTLTINTANSFTGGTTINSGGIVANTATALGVGTGPLLLGTPASETGTTTTPTGTLTMNASLTVGNFFSTTDNTTADVITINPGYTLTDTGGFSVGAVNDNSSNVVFNGALTLTGGGSLAMTGVENFNIGQGSIGSGNSKDTTTADFSGLNSVNINITGTVGIGFAQNSKGSLTLANTTAASVAPSNFISATEIDVGNSNGGNDAGTSTLNLGSGSNTLDASTINIGAGKTGGVITWVSNATSASSVTIAGTGGIGAANITLGNASVATYGNDVSQLLLAGHSANVQAGTLIVGENTGNSSNAPNASVTFDTGTFTAQSVIVAADTGGTSTAGLTGAITIGGSSPNTTATGVFTVGSSESPGTFDLGDFTNNVSATATANFVINSGVANIFGNIAVLDTSASGSVKSSLTLAGNGALNMEGNSIGTAMSPVTTVQLAANASDSVKVENLGGAGINGAGLTMKGLGTLTLLGSNTYSGGTTVNSGLLVVGANGALPVGNVSITGGTLRLAASTGLATITSLSVTGNGVFDVNNNHLIINYGNGPDPIGSVAALLKSGYAGGAWNGHGIDSTAAAANSASYGLGYADAADPGNPAGLSSGNIEVMYTLLGDANLSGVVDGTDFGIVAANFNKGVSGWDEGDFNYDNVVDGSDFGDLAANFNKGAAGAAATAALDAFAAANGLLADVPEPASAMMVAAGLATLLRRRRASR